MLRMTRAELSKLYDGLLPPKQLPQGLLMGAAMGVPLLEHVPAALRGGLLHLINGPVLGWCWRWFWRGKFFEIDGRGGNCWVLGGARCQWGMYRARMDESRACLLLDYSSGDNPAWLLNLRGELREFAPGSLLGKVWYRERLLMFFTLQESNES